MIDNTLHPELKRLCDSLDSAAQAIFTATTDNRNLNEWFGWNYPALNRIALSRLSSDLSQLLQDRGLLDLDEHMLTIVRESLTSVERVKAATIPHFWNGNGHLAVPAYINTIQAIKTNFEPMLGWQSIKDRNLIPAKLAKRIRSYEATLDEIAPKRDELTRRIKLINDAHDAAESLPTDLATLEEARKRIATSQTDVQSMQDKIGVRLIEAEGANTSIKTLQVEASKLVSQCEEAYRITTTKGLAAAFDQRAGSLAKSMWVWVFGLICALTVGYFMGSNRLNALTELLNSADKQHETVWPTAFLALVSLGAPLWLAWIATKQIGQRFRLAEDYAFKASVAKAYEGYRKEAAKIDKAFEARLFSSALTRLEEAPLRLVEKKTHGSPWQELLESDSFRDALKVVPNLREHYDKLLKKIGGKEKGSLGEDSKL